MRVGIITLRPDGAAPAQAALEALIGRVGVDVAGMVMQTLMVNAKLEGPANWPQFEVRLAPEAAVAADVAARAYLLGHGWGSRRYMRQFGTIALPPH